jgi:hypothetical protein
MNKALLSNNNISLKQINVGGGANNNENTITQKKHIKLINKKTDESLDSLSYFDETHIQKIRNELNSNMRQSQIAVIPPGMNPGQLSSVKTSLVNNSFENDSSLFSNNKNNNNNNNNNNTALVVHSTGNQSMHEDKPTGLLNSTSPVHYGSNSTTVATVEISPIKETGSGSGGGGSGNKSNRSKNPDENTALNQSTARTSSNFSQRKEKKTSVGYRLGKRKLLFEKRRQISDYALIFAMTGVILMILETEFSMSMLYTKVSLKHVLVKPY